MRTPSGELHVVDFKTKQIVASIQPADYWGDKRHWEIKNNIDTLEFHVFDNTRHSSTLMQQNLVLKEVRDGRIVPYVITEIEKDSDDRSVIAYASGEWIQLAKDGIIQPQKLEGKTVMEMVDIALAGTKWQKGNLEYASFRSMTIDEFIDPLSFLKKIASLFELEIQYRAEVVGSQVVGRYVDMVKKRGRETGKEITLGKDLMGIKRIENSQNICSALLGFVKKEGGEFVTITEINGGVPYLVDSDAFQRWNENGQHKFGFYSPETENEDMDPKRLMTLMNTELKKRVNSSVFYEVEAQSIGRVFGLAHELINEGDTIRIKDTGFTPKLYLEARAIAGDESFKNPLQDKYVFGDYHEIIDPNEELRKIYNRILSSLGNKQEMIDQLDKLVKEANETASNAKKESEAAKTLAEKVQENIKNNTVEIIESKNPPTTGLKPYKTLWRDISNGKPGILKIWTGTAWESVVPDVESVKKETLEQVSKDIESTKTELNQKVQEAQNQATGQFNEVQEGLQGVSRTISNITNKQGEIDKKVTKFEQDSSGFKTSIESLTKKDTEISNKLNTVESTVEGTKQTITDIQSTTDSLTKTTNEIKQTAISNTESISQVTNRLDKLKVGGSNIFLNTTFDNGMTNWTVITNVSVDTTVKYKGFNTLKSDQRGETTARYRGAEQKNLPFTIGEPYTASFYVMTDDINTFDDILRIEIICERDDNTRTATFRTDIDIKGLGNNNWGRYSATGIIPKETTKVRVGCRVWKNGRVWIALPQFEEGNIMTDWHRADKDQVSAVDFTKKTTEIEKSVDGVKTTVSKVQDSQAGFEKRMTTVEQTASGLSSTVSNLNNVVSDQGKKLTEANTKIEQQATAINAKVELKQVEDYVAGFKIPELKQTVNQNKEDLLDELANKLATEQFNQKMTLIDNRFSVNEEGIDLAAKKTEVYTRIQADGQFAKDSYVRDLEGRIQVTESNILSTVKKGDIISSINQTAETIKIKAGRIELDGTTIAKYLEAQELRGTTIRTDNGANYVHIQKQFIRLMESNLNRMFLGYYWNKDGRIQPTILLHENVNTSKFTDGTLAIAQQNLGTYYTGSIGIAKGETSPGDTYYPSKLNLNSNGNTLLYGDNKTTITGEMGIDFRSFRQVSTFASLIRLEASGNMDILSGDRLFVRGTNGITFNTSGAVSFNTQVSTQGVNIAGGGPDAIGTIKYMNGSKGWGAYLHIGSSGWAFINISI